MSPQDLLAEISHAVAAWLPDQRWFAGKGRQVRSVEPISAITLTGTDPQLVHAVVAVHSDDSRTVYQLPLGLRDDLPEHLGNTGITASGSRVVYDAAQDPELAGELLRLFAEGATFDTDTVDLRFTLEAGVEIDPSQRPRPMSVEQSHTSVVFGQEYILKLYRRIALGESPDLELHRALARVGCKHIATPLGALEGNVEGVRVTLGMLGEFLPNTADGWAMATASVRDLLAQQDIDTIGDDMQIIETDPADVGGDFASEAHRLGGAVATVHADLSRALGQQPVAGAELELLTAEMHERLDKVLPDVPELARLEPGIRSAFDAVRQASPGPDLQRIHADLHLGQVLRHVTGWIVIDFEGEPSTPLEQRSRPGSPLRDVAGMLRSFDYAARHMVVGPDAPELHVAAAERWAERNKAAFCDGYAEIGPDPRGHDVVLHAFELDKAIYEVGYEHGHRPGWMQIPLAAIERILEGAK